MRVYVTASCASEAMMVTTLATISRTTEAETFVSSTTRSAVQFMVRGPQRPLLRQHLDVEGLASIESVREDVQQ